MFDFSFWELAIVLAVALVVVGPDKLPVLAAKLGRWVGKIRHMLTAMRSDIEQELKAAELQEMLEQQQDEISQLRNIIKDTQHTAEQEINAISNDADGLKQQADIEVAKSTPADKSGN